VDNAFQLALTTDPLADSGEEDEDARCDYSELYPSPNQNTELSLPMLVFRLHVVNRLRGRAPTPEVDDADFIPSASTPINITRRHSDGQDRSASPGTTPPEQRGFY